MKAKKLTGIILTFLMASTIFISKTYGGSMNQEDLSQTPGDSVLYIGPEMADPAYQYSAVITRINLTKPITVNLLVTLPDTTTQIKSLVKQGDPLNPPSPARYYFYPVN